MGQKGFLGEWLVGQWIVGVISFQKIFGLCGLKGRIVERDRYRHGQTECEDIARFLELKFAINFINMCSRIYLQDLILNEPFIEDDLELGDCQMGDCRCEESQAAHCCIFFEV